MSFATDTNSQEDVRKRIKEAFTEFNRNSAPSHGRRYPIELRQLIFQGHLAGLKPKELMRLSGMSSTAVTYATKKNSRSGALLPHKQKSKSLAPRRLEVVSELVEPVEDRSPLVIRLPSGVVLELRDGTALTSSLIHVLANVEVNHVTSR